MLNHLVVIRYLELLLMNEEQEQKDDRQSYAAEYVNG